MSDQAEADQFADLSGFLPGTDLPHLAPDPEVFSQYLDELSEIHPFIGDVIKDRLRIVSLVLHVADFHFESQPGCDRPEVLVGTATSDDACAWRLDDGTVLLVGTDRGRIVSGVERVMLDGEVYRAMSRAHNPYGDGKAAQRIAQLLRSRAWMSKQQWQAAA